MKDLKSAVSEQSYDQFYVKKYHSPIFPSTPGKDLKIFLEQFLDDKLRHHSVQEERIQPSMVKNLNQDTFEKEILKAEKVKQCVIEIVKDHCGACMFAKFNTNIIS